MADTTVKRSTTQPIVDIIESSEAQLGKFCVADEKMIDLDVKEVL